MMTNKIEYIDNYFTKVAGYINGLPLPEKIKAQLYYYTFCKFYDELVPTEDGSTTIGITSKFQLEQFIKDFQLEIKKIRLKHFQLFSEHLKSIDHKEAMDYLNSSIYTINQKELLMKIGGDKCNEFQLWLRDYLQNEKAHLSYNRNLKSNSNKNSLLDDLKNNFDDVDIQLVYNHFFAGLVRKGYLSEEKLIQYLTFAFDKMQIPSEKFKFDKIETKYMITRVFYTYYKQIAGKAYGKQKEYAALLGDYFIGFKTSTIITNFSKAIY